VNYIDSYEITYHSKEIISPVRSRVEASAMATDSSSRRVELFVRSLSPAPTRSPVDDHLRRLRTLAGGERVADLSVDVWGREVGLSTTAARTDAGERVLDRVAAFREWAGQRGVTLEPFFETREVGAGLTGEPHTALVLPVCCLAEYEDNDLVHVAPYATEMAVHSVSDRIRALERERAASSDRDRRDGARAGTASRAHSPRPVGTVAETVATVEERSPDPADDASPTLGQ